MIPKTVPGMGNKAELTVRVRPKLLNVIVHEACTLRTIRSGFFRKPKWIENLDGNFLLRAC
jgi:hypothetical protein